MSDHAAGLVKQGKPGLLAAGELSIAAVSTAVNAFAVNQGSGWGVTEEPHNKHSSCDAAFNFDVQRVRNGRRQPGDADGLVT